MFSFRADTFRQDQPTDPANHNGYSFTADRTLAGRTSYGSVAPAGQIRIWDTQERLNSIENFLISIRAGGAAFAHFINRNGDGSDTTPGSIDDRNNQNARQITTSRDTNTGQNPETGEPYSFSTQTFTEVTVGLLYEVAAVTAANWSSIGGPANAAVGNTFLASTTDNNIANLGSVRAIVPGMALRQTNPIVADERTLGTVIEGRAQPQLGFIDIYLDNDFTNFADPGSTISLIDSRAAGLLANPFNGDTTTSSHTVAGCYYVRSWCRL